MPFALSARIAPVTSQVASIENSENLWLAGMVYMLILLAGVVVDIVLGARLLMVPCGWNERVARMKALPWNWKQAGFILLLLVGINLAVGGVTRGALALGWLTGEEPDSFWALLGGLTIHVAGLFILFEALRRRNCSWNRAFGFSRHKLLLQIGRGMVGFLAVMPFIFFSALVYQMVLTWLGYPVTLQDVALVFVIPQSLLTQILLLFLALIIAPVFEEALFRGILLPLLLKKLSIGWSVVICSGFFAVIHMHVPAMAPLFVVAVGFALAYIYTGTIIVPITMHVLFNTVNTSLLLFTAA